ncbi:hypothetical protein G9A89_019464 [Geosiphon pyriformis]|nr:hypothetical protein G9A89_019464 [Geosiphon pyriformis]
MSKPGRRRRKESDAEYKLSESEEESESDASTKDSPGRKVVRRGAGSVISIDSENEGEGESYSEDESENSDHASPGDSGKKGKIKSALTNVIGKKPKTSTPNKGKQKTVVTSSTTSVGSGGSLNQEKTVGESVKQKVTSKILKKNPSKKQVILPKKQQKDNDKENDATFVEDIELLSKLPLPSTTRRHRYNQNISMIGSINIQAFGTKKASNNVLMRIIIDILRRYDIVLCQEIHSPKDNETIIQQLCDEVSTPSTPYAYVASHPIGRKQYRERYVYLYRANEWKVIDEYVIDDDEKLGDLFMREPYVVRFQHLRKPDVRITLVGCHTQPDNAFEEISSLVGQVYPIVKRGMKPTSKRPSMQQQHMRDSENDEKPLTTLQKLRNIFCCCFPYSSVSTRDINDLPRGSSEKLTSTSGADEPIIMMGDLNAAGSYVNKTKRVELDALLKKHDLVWGIPNTTDTTVSDGSDSAYDRFIFESENERRWIGNSGVWRFDDGWLEGKSGKDDINLIKRAAKRVSDHYSIEFELKLV